MWYGCRCRYRVLGRFVYFVCYKFRWKSVWLARMRHTHTLNMFLYFRKQGEGLFFPAHNMRFILSTRYLFYDTFDAKLKLNYCFGNYLLFFFFLKKSNRNVVAGAAHSFAFIFLIRNATSINISNFMRCQNEWRHTRMKVQWHRCIEFRSGWSIQNTRFAYTVCMCVWCAFVFSSPSSSRTYENAFILGQMHSKNFECRIWLRATMCGFPVYFFFFVILCEAKNLRK